MNPFPPLHFAISGFLDLIFCYITPPSDPGLDWLLLGTLDS